MYMDTEHAVDEEIGEQFSTNRNGFIATATQWTRDHAIPRS